MPIDKSYILEALETQKEKENYLKKLFDLEIYIKEYTKQSLYGYTQSLIYEHFVENLKLFKKEDKRRQVNNISFLISQKYSKDPRKIIKFLNLLKMELSIYSFKETQEYIPKGEVSKHIDFLSKVLIIREQWPEDYREIVLRPYHLLNSYTSLVNNNSISQTEIVSIDKKETRTETKFEKNNEEEINELINLKKEMIDNLKPHYFLGWDDGKLNDLSELLDKKLSFEEIQKKYEGEKIE